MSATRYMPSPGDLASTSATKSKTVFLILIFLGCLLVATAVSFKAAYGFTEIFLETPALASLGEQSVALASMLVTIFGVVAVYMKKLGA